MAQTSGMVPRGLLLLGLMLILVTVVGFVLFRPADSAPRVPAEILKRQPSKPGWEVRYNATVALARRGSENLPLDVLAEMLDEEQQMRNFVGKTPEGEDFVEEQAARKTVLNALKALEEWHKHKAAVQKVGADNPDLKRVYAAVDKLTQNQNAVLQQEAEALKKAIGSR